MRHGDPRWQVIQRITEALKARYKPEKIILFGSYASGRATAVSDVDLLIVKRTSEPFYRRLASVRHLVSPYRRGIPFDPIVVTPQELNARLSLGDQFLKSILQSGKVLYARS